MVFKPELLSPAGTAKSMRFAFAYGADAVYAGQPRYSLRTRNNEFNHLDIMADAIVEAHKLGKKFYVASNISAHNDKVRTYLRDMQAVIDMKPDALIMSDPGLIMMVRETWPEMPIHLSVQSNAVNYATVRFWKRQGLTRVILSRELSLEEMEEIRAECPDMELEVFVHGALCIAYSGRCLLSGYLNHRDPNQGTCTNACRWKYNAYEAREVPTGDIVTAKEVTRLARTERLDPLTKTQDDIPVFLLEEQSRPGELMPAMEDEHGTYIMNSKDLRAVQHIPRLVQMRMDCLKIEGRTKSHYYVARTAQVYRRAIDMAVSGESFDDKSLMAQLEHLANRGYTEGFYRRHVPQEYQNYEQGVTTNPNQQFVGEVLSIDSDRGWAEIEVKNRFVQGDTMELITPSGNMTFVVDAIENMDGISVGAAPGSGHVVRIPLPVIPATGDDSRYALLMRHISHA